MRDNAFDNGVQDKMEEFRLTPSAPVWPEVERRIRERRKRRVLIFWFCLAGLLLTGTGAWWMLNEKSVTHTTPVTEINSVNTPTKINSTEATAHKTGLSESPVKTGATTTATGDSSNTPVSDESALSKTKTISNSTNRNQPVTIKPASVKPASVAPFDDNKAKLQVTAMNGKKAKRGSVNKNSAAIPDNKPISQAATPFPVADTITASPLVSTDQQTAVASVPVPALINDKPVNKADTVRQAKPDAVQPETPVKGHKKGPHKWQTGLVFAFGEAKLTESRFSLFSMKSFDALQSGVSAGNGNFSSSSFADSLPLKGPAFHAGLYAKRKIGKKTSFSAGLNLAYYSGKQRVGVFVDSVRLLPSPYSTRTGGGFYRSGSSGQYTNKYYYLQLPLLLHWQLNKGAKLPPLEWENGFVPSIIVGSRALVYDQGSSIFFRDRSVYNRFSLVYQTGFTATFASRTRHPLTAGLYYNYHFSKLQGVNPPDFNHQSSYGIQFRWIFRK